MMDNIHLMIASLIAFTLACAISVNVVVVVYAQQQPATKQSSLSQHITTVKITSPTKGQQVPAGKDLTISGISTYNATKSKTTTPAPTTLTSVRATSTSSGCQVSIIVNKVKPYQNATAAGNGGPTDFSKWNYVLTSKYTIIKPGPNRITAKYECANNPALTSFSTINVTGVAAGPSITTIGSPSNSIAPQAVKGINKSEQTRSITSSSPQQPMPSPISQIPKQTNNTRGNGGGSSSATTTTTNVPIVLKPLPGGTCTEGYHLVSGAVCIKDVTPPPSPSQAAATTASATPPVATPTNNATASFSLPLPSATQLNTNPVNNGQRSEDSSNGEKFNTKILKSFNKEFKRQNR